MASNRLRSTPETEEAPFEMANLRPATTGLPSVAFVSQRGAARHDPIIKVSPLPRYDPDDAVTITLETPPRALRPTPPRDLAQITQWIELNRAAFDAYWDGDIAFTEDLLERIKPLS